MFEQRALPRLSTLKTGKIIVADGADSIDCAILELSEEGARILVVDPAEIPQNFVLKIDRTQATYICQRVWTQGSRIGLSCRSARFERGEP